MSFRDNLQHLRAERNMTQEQLAMLLGVSRQSVTKWEAEKSQPEMDKLLKMCEIFDCTLDELVTGDLTGRAAPATAAPIPAGPPTDVCGYEEHQRMMALKVPTGVALILLGIALGLLFEGAVELASWNGRDGLFVIIVLVGVLAGLAFLVPAGMEHTAFQKAHPYVEDFYTDEDRAAARRQFSTALIAGLALIFAGIGCVLMLEKTRRTGASSSSCSSSPWACGGSCAAACCSGASTSRSTTAPSQKTSRWRISYPQSWTRRSARLFSPRSDVARSSARCAASS